MTDSLNAAHCRRGDDHVPHQWEAPATASNATQIEQWTGPLQPTWCMGGPWAAPGHVGRQAADDAEVIEILASQWRENRAARHEVPIGTSQRAFMDDSYRFARDAINQLRRAGVEVVLTPGARRSRGLQP